MGSYTTNFILRTDKVNSKGEHPIILTISVSNQPKKISTKVSVLFHLWDKENKQIAYSLLDTDDPEYPRKQKRVPINRSNVKRLLPDVDYNSLPMADDVKQLNNKLLDVKNKVEKIADRFELDNIEYSSEMVVNSYKQSLSSTTKKEDASTLVYDFIDKYIVENEPTRAPGSLSVYKALKKHLKAFETQNKNKIKFSEINYAFLQSFQNFLVKHRNVNNITIAKQLSTLKTFLGYAKKNDIVVNEGYKDFPIKREKLEVIAFTNHEFQKLVDLDLSESLKYFKSSFLKHQDGTPKSISYSVLDKVRDLMVFACSTGFRYSDQAQLDWPHIKGQEITITVKKTKQLLVIPLNKYSFAILEKYKNQKRPLPIISNQKYNDYVKVLCEMAGINEPIEIVRFRGREKISVVYPKYELISSHTGRKTFCTRSLELGIPAEVVMKMSGHEDYKSFQRYVKVTEERKRNEMAKAWGLPSHLKVVNSDV